ncbi:hypothetical protein FI667_g11520, partial [Globisporangium splendens]
MATSSESSSTRSGSNSSSSSSGSLATVSSPSVTKTASTDSRDSCTWYANGECSASRTCFDCLNVLLPNTECAVDPRGACVSMVEYDKFMSSSSFLSTNANYTYFPSTNATYCNPSDATCSVCRSQWLADYYTLNSSSVPSVPYCTGDNGCVCIAYCELPGWTNKVVSSQCASKSVLGGSEEPAGYKLLTALGLGLAMVLVFTVIHGGIRFLIRKCEARGASTRDFAAEEAERNRRLLQRREPRGPQLNLNGYHAMLDKLIETERQQLANGRSTVHGITGIGATEPPTIVVEHGEGYRPESPSELGRYLRARDQTP